MKAREDSTPLPYLSVIPAQQTGRDWWLPRHYAKLTLKSEAPVDLLWLGDSITHNWEDAGRDLWKRTFSCYNPFNLGFSGDRTENLLWRLHNGAVDGLSPRVAVLLIGTNNTGHRQDPPHETLAGIQEILRQLQARLPSTRLLLLELFPRGDTPQDPFRKLNDTINQHLPRLCDGKTVELLRFESLFCDSNRTLDRTLMPDGLHPNAKGYSLWAESIKPILAHRMNQALA